MNFEGREMEKKFVAPRASDHTRQAFMFLNSIFLAVVVSFVLEPIVIGSYIPTRFLQSFQIPVIVLTWGLRIVILSGIYGALVEMASGERDVCTLRQIQTNAREYWLVYGALSLIPAAAHMLLFALVPGSRVPVVLAGIVWDVPVLYFFAQNAVLRKYLRPMGLSRQAVPVPMKDVPVLAAAVLIPLISGYYFTLIPDLSGSVAMSVLYKLWFLGTRYAQVFLFLYFCVAVLSRYPSVRKRFSPEKEIILISPLPQGLVASFGMALLRMYPPVFVLLKALTPPEYRIKEFVQVLWRDHYYKGGALVAITSFTSNAAAAYRIAKGYRDRGSKVVMGGAHVMFLPEEALEFCDSVVVGDAEPVWDTVIEDYENGCLKKIYYGKADDAYYDSSHRHLLKMDPSLLAGYIETGRGCKFHCDFCVIPSIFGQKIRNKPVAQVVELLERVKTKTCRFGFVDNNIFANPAYAKDLFREIAPLKMKWSASCSLDIARDEEALTLLKEAGCTDVFIGYEIFSDSEEKRKCGKYRMADDYLSLTRKIKQAGIKIKASFIFGFDGDSVWTFFKLWKFCMVLFPKYGIISLLTPLPGSKLFQDLLRENRLLSLNWSQYDFRHMVFRSKNVHPFLVGLLFPVFVYLFLFFTSLIGIVLFLWLLFF